MNLKKMNKEELELMSYDDIAYELLKESKHQMKIIDLFNEIGKLIDLSAGEIEEKVADFFEMLTLDKRFIMLDDGSWDLKERHAQNIVIDDEEEDISVEEIEDESEEEKDEDIFFDENNDDDDTEDDLKDLVVVDEEEEESNY